jgi:hypothetical protein
LNMLKLNTCMMGGHCIVIGIFLIMIWIGVV